MKWNNKEGKKLRLVLCLKGNKVWARYTLTSYELLAFVCESTMAHLRRILYSSGLALIQSEKLTPEDVAW